ncbi:MAG: alpha/beta fold hydrolase [Elusimicrobiota bacterium]
MPLGSLALSLSAAAAVAAAPAPASVSLRSADGWTLEATYRPARPGRPTLILAHGVGSARAEWSRLAERLALKGVGTLAVDLRGHGGSLNGPWGRADFTSFDARSEWPRAEADVRAAASWLELRGVPRESIAFGGASIGANLAAAVAADASRAPFLLLLSPGTDYRGVRLKARPGLDALAVASMQDAYAFSAVDELRRRGLATVLTAPAGHGVQVFDDPATLEAVVSWVARLRRRTPP